MANSSATGQLTMNASSQQIPDDRDGSSAGKEQGIQVTVDITAPAAVDVYVGYATGVTTGTGHRIPAGASKGFSLKPLERLWVIGASGVVTWARSVW